MIHKLAEGPSFTVPPETWKDARNNIVKLGIQHVTLGVMKKYGFFRVSTTGWNGSFFTDHVETAVVSGTFGRIKYGVQNLSRSVVTLSKKNPGWRESSQPAGKLTTTTMKGLFDKFRGQWNQPENKALDKTMRSDQELAENLQTLANGKTFLYGESYSDFVNESSINGVEKKGDLNLPINIMLLYLRLQVLCHNFISARGVSGLWTYVYGPWSGTVFHVEDAFLPSVNLNMGPGRKLWYFVPRSYFKQLQDFYARMGLGPNGDGCAHHYQHKRLAPNFQALLDAGIPVYYLVQRPGDLIFVDGCVIHEVINWGYGFSQATNVLLPSWINVAEAGLFLRSNCCTEYLSDLEFSAKALTERLYALYRRLKPNKKIPTDTAVLDKEIGLLTGLPWEHAKQKYEAEVRAVGFGQSVSPDDIALDLRGMFVFPVAHIYADPRSPADRYMKSSIVRKAAELVTPPSSLSLDEDASTSAAGESTGSATASPLHIPHSSSGMSRNSCDWEPVITLKDFETRTSKRIRGVSPSPTSCCKRTRRTSQ